jgi:hypothetical protein
MANFKLKDSTELLDMLKKVDGKDLNTCAEIIEYIDRLHNVLKGYQITVDFVVNRNVNVE